LSGEEIVGFHEQLRRAVAALDTPAHRRQPVADLTGAVPGPLSEDGCEDARLAVVAAGRRRWAEVVADPAMMAGVWPLELGEELGRAAADAYEQVTGTPWPAFDLASAPDTGLPPVARHRWLTIIPLWGELTPRAAYEVQLAWLERTLNHPAWERWWDSGRGHDGSCLTCWYHFGSAGRRRSSIRVVTIRLALPQAEWPELGGGREGWAELARMHVQLLFDVLGSKLGIDHPPDLPPAAELERERLDAAERDAADSEAFNAWNEERTTAVPNIWTRRAPADAIGELIRTLENGGRIRIPAMIAEMRGRYGIPATGEDARLLAGYGYSPEEIATALA
jgi:hypothetical protein